MQWIHFEIASLVAHQRPLPPPLSRCWANAGNALQGASVRYGPLLANRWNSPNLD
ncbi:hypothetical protein FVEG_15637 [Fusarium verticillioides 7600]|uniref:Uncharacterized protein n=1 Tax=Gibberella moniliformis (strain M3125 / FGSC 7600) TaxID=334819 RepID=W7M069_GIBM7|nr:hypothetical protein FVEG_15637 [Fusarium verticillioides 7600]EWG44361.1 hypothetical protein FVEG_15637 [Fusarium verticillioides 7600]